MRSISLAAIVSVIAAFGMAPATAQTEQKKPEPPHNYRQYVARAVVFHYNNRTKGPPKISETPRRGGGEFCVHFPVEKSGLLVGDPTKTELRSFTVSIGRDIFGARNFRTGGGDVFSGACPGAMQPFPELEKLAAQVKACRDKGGSGCGGDAFEVSKVSRELQRLP